MEGCTEVVYRIDPTMTHFVKGGQTIARRVITNRDGCRVEWWYKGDTGNKVHRTGDLPAMIRHDNGQKTEECWFEEGRYHRQGGQPAVIWYKNGQKIDEWYYKNGIEYAPAVGQAASIEGELAKIKRRTAKNEASMAAIDAMLAK